MSIHYRWGHSNVAEFLLNDGHCDPNCTAKDGPTPLAVATDTSIIRLLLQHGAVATDLYKYLGKILPGGIPTHVKPVQSTVALFMVGDKGAGKSTLTKALMTEKDSRISSWAAKHIKCGGVKERTAGIECHTIHSSRIGSFTIYDLAGHREFHNSHDTIIRSCISGKSSGMFLFVIDLRASLDDLKHTVSYWLSFIQSQVHIKASPQVSTPYLLAVGSHVDSVKSRTDLEEKKIVVQHLCISAGHINFVDYVAFDCRYSESPSLTKLRAHLQDTHDKLQSSAPEMTFHAHCFHVYLVSECGDKPGMQLGSLMEIIDSDPAISDEKCLPNNLQHLHETCMNLSERGIMTYIQTRSIDNSWIIIDKDMLFREVNGTLFAPKHFIEHKILSDTCTGVVPFSKLCSAFTKLIETELIVDFMIHMEFCREIREEDLLNIVTETHTEYKHERHFLFPALTQPNPPPNLWQPHPSEYCCCWILRCLDQHYLNPRFHQILLLRLAFEHADAVESYKVAPTSPVLHQQCTIWKNGIKWTTDSSDVLVEIGDHTVVLLLCCRNDVSKKIKELELVNTRAQVISQILSAKAEFCSSVKTVEEFIPDPKYPLDSCTTGTSGVSLQKLAQAICNDRENVLMSPNDLFPIAKLLGFEPYQFCNLQCLIDLYNKELESCKVTEQFMKCIARKMSQCHMDDFCTLLNVSPDEVAVETSEYHKAVTMFKEWQSYSKGTYQCLRKQMDQYSVFSGRNILV